MTEKIKINKIFLDLDGVIRDWSGGVFKWFDVEPIIPTNWDTTANYICKECDISESYFWNKQDFNFWFGLKMFPRAQEILDLLPTNKTCILTAPTLNNAGGTQRWIESRLPILFKKKQYLIGPAKHFCAAPDTLLIDDSDVNIKKFAEAGGNVILFPQPWNENKIYLENKVDLDYTRMYYLKAQLNRYDF